MMASILLLPWSTSITGPVSSSASNDTDTWSSGMMSGSGDINGTLELDYCGKEEALASLNENSINRIPIGTWVILLSILIPFFAGG